MIASAIAFALAACNSLAACNEKTAEPTPAPSAVTSARTQANAPPTQEATGAIVARVQSKGLQVTNLGIVRSGTVLKLSGVAKTDADKKGAEEIARQSPGVTDVQSSITVQP